MKTSEARLLASICREDFYTFLNEFWGTVVAEPFVSNWHIELACRILQDAAERVFRVENKKHDLIFNLPTGSSKSTICSIMFPAWAWTRMPSFRLIGASYSDKVALDLSRRCRDVVKSELYQAVFPEIKLRGDMDAKGYFGNTKMGSRYAVGSEGSVQGMHGHMIIIDDPIDPNRTASEAEIYSINEWIKSTLSGRKVNKPAAVEVLVMQRLHQNDPTKLFSERKRVKWLRVPASTEFEVRPPELLSRYRAVPGYPYKLLDPVRLPAETLEEEREPSRLGEYGYAAQYGQDPVPAGGGMFKVDQIGYGMPPGRYKKIVRFWDKAATPPKPGQKRGPAWTVGVKMGIDEVDLVWVLDVVRVRMDSFSREALIVRTAKADGPRVQVGVEQEGGSGGKDSAVSTLVRLRGLTDQFRILQAKGSKEIRADEFSVQVNAGLVRLPQWLRVGDDWVGWAKAYLEELKHWPFSTFKDQGDASGGAYSLCAQGMVEVGPLTDHPPSARNPVFDQAGPPDADAELLSMLS